MELYPAIDLMNGGCVRLNEGDFNACAHYSGDPGEVARAYRAAGAGWLHLVDLDGARSPLLRQKSAIAALVAGSALKIQTGGGVRTAADVDELLILGAQRVVIGSLCVRNPKEAMNILHRHGPEKIVLAFDVRGDFERGFFIATAGWRDTSAIRIEDMIAQYTGSARHVLCTDISKDGKLSGPNTALYRYLRAMAPDLHFQASGGVSQLSDLEELKACGVAGVVIGKALYEKKFTLDEALRKVA